LKSFKHIKINTMKKIFSIIILALSAVGAFAQGHLEGIVVERVPVTAAATAADPALASGNVAYRVYADLAAGWELQAIYALATHESKIATTTEFYNNGTIGGAAYGRSMGNPLFNNAAGRFDSYITIGAVTGTRVGVLQVEDTDGTVDGFLNAATEALSSPDASYEVWADVNVPGTFSTFTGIVSQNNGEEGRTSTNRVLLGQFTTDGNFSFELNLQIRLVGTSTVERFVAKTPGTGETLFAGLTYASGAVPTVSISAPANAGSVQAGVATTITASAADADGIAKVEFYWKGVKIGEDNVPADGITFAWTPATANAGAGALSALAIDNHGDIAWATNNITVTTSVPSITITSPAGASVKTNIPFNIAATITDAGGSISLVKAFVGGVEQTPVTQNADVYSIAPYTATAAGSLTIRFEATDNDANTTITSKTVNVVNNAAPTVSLTAPVNGSTVTEGATVTVSAEANDADGIIAGVQFYAGATAIGAEVTAAPYTVNWTAAGTNVSLTAVARDDNGALTTSAARNVIVGSSTAGYYIKSVSDTCYNSDVFCMPILTSKAIDNVLGYDMILKYEQAKVMPTGVIYVSNDLLGTVTYDKVESFVNIGNGQMNISLAFKLSAPANAKFVGGIDKQLICVEFVKKAAFTATSSALFEIDELLESKVSGALPVVVTDGSFTSLVDQNFTGKLTFWKDNAAIVNNGPATNLGVGIYPSTDGLNRILPSVVYNDNQGKFNINVGATADRKYIMIARQIAPSSSVQPIVNGADAQLVARMIVNDAGFRPNIYQMFAMDVNRDGKVTAGDLTQIQMRSVLKYSEFRQTDNYNDQGVKTGKDSKDWLFVKGDSLYTAPYRISNDFPRIGTTGYSRYKVPVADTVQSIKIIGTECIFIEDETFQGIMLGDVDGSYAAAPSSPALKSTAKSTLVFDLANAKVADGYADVPVYFTSNADVTSLDFALQFNEESFSLRSVEKQAAGLEAADYFNTDDRTLRFSSYSINKLESGKNMVSIRFVTNGNQLKSSDLKVVSALVNGNEAIVKVTELSSLVNGLTVNVYPNPANSVLNVEVSADAKVVLMDMSGRSILFESEAVANQPREINISSLADGIYMLKVYSSEFVKVQKVVVKK
jgi:hypothetical protein